MSNIADALGVEHIVYDEETIRRRVAEVGAQITKDFAGE